MKQTYDDVPPEMWDGLAEMDDYNIKHILSLFALIGVPESYLDVGCGTGIMVRTAQKLGVRAFGVDQLVDKDDPQDGFYHANLVNKFILDEKVALISSFEVAEHLHESAHATFCDSICNNLIKEAGNHLIFSAARPGQAGNGHIACRPAHYWHEQFIMRGLSYDEFSTVKLGLLWSNIGSGLNYMWDNLMVFTV
ncbi:MAG: methyltransferase domain-containing protein [Deltaproteobacteria bacterium]|nr:methyltransferase domain-containing protein [Deltaproteobacteria bacterium]